YPGLDGFGRLIDLHFVRDAGGSAETVHRYQYHHDAAGNRLWARVTQAEEPGSPPVAHVNDRSWHYRYDPLNRLTKAERGALSDNPDPNQMVILGNGGVERVKIDWVLDSVGNWTADGWPPALNESVVLSTGAAGGGPYEAAATVHHEARYDNRLAWITTGDGAWLPSQTSTTIETDANGNLTDDGTGHYEYDVFNRLVFYSNGDPCTPCSNTLVRYDALGRAVSTFAIGPGGFESAHHYYDGVRRIQDWKKLGSVPYVPVREYIYGPDYVDEHMAQIVPGDPEATPEPTEDEIVYTLQDANYNVVALLDADGTVLRQYSWTPYGQLDDSDGLYPHPPNRVGHQGLFWMSFGVPDGVTPSGELADELLPPSAEEFFRTDLNGAFYSRARLYSPHLGRFLTPDPNESALPFLTAAYMNGQTAMASHGLFNAQALYGDGMNLYAAYGSNPLANRDAMGLAYNAYEDAIDEQIDYLNGHRLYALGAINEGARAASIGLNLALDIAGTILGIDIIRSIGAIFTGGGGFWDALNVVTAISPVARIARIGRAVDNAMDLAATAGRVGGAAARAGGKFLGWLNKGQKNVSVYIGYKGKVATYVGISADVGRRGKQHADRFDKLNTIASGLTRNQARALEQLIMDKNVFTNMRNSLDPMSEFFVDAYNWAEQYAGTYGIRLVWD
ncbi:MAG: hypothetical protein HOP29_14030, partial [Phycisphaerales bacterium]|nr:hypothetical protein [Phycisphaerales bacterium]